MHWPEGILRELALVLIERELRLSVPLLTLCLGEVLPGEPDDLRERTVVRLDLGGDVPALDERRAEENERVRWPGYVVLRFSAPVCCRPPQGMKLLLELRRLALRQSIDD